MSIDKTIKFDCECENSYCFNVVGGRHIHDKEGNFLSLSYVSCEDCKKDDETQL